MESPFSPVDRISCIYLGPVSFSSPPQPLITIFPLHFYHDSYEFLTSFTLYFTLFYISICFICVVTIWSTYKAIGCVLCFFATPSLSSSNRVRNTLWAKHELVNRFTWNPKLPFGGGGAELKLPPPTTTRQTTWSDSVCGGWGGVKQLETRKKISVCFRILLTEKEPRVLNFSFQDKIHLLNGVYV